MTELAAYVAGFRERGYRAEDSATFLAAWDRLEGLYLRRLDDVQANCETWRDRFRAAAAETVRLVEEHPLQARFLVVDSLAAGELGSKRQQELSKRLIEYAEGARAELEEPERIPTATAPWIVAIFFDRVYRHLVNQAQEPLDRHLPELLFLAISAYFGTEAGLRELSFRS